MVKLGYLRPFTSGVGNISTANQELLEVPVTGNVKKAHTVHFYSNADCTLIWNDELTFEVKANAGLYLDERFEPTFSLKIVEADIEYYIAYGF